MIKSFLKICLDWNLSLLMLFIYETVFHDSIQKSKHLQYIFLLPALGANRDSPSFLAESGSILHSLILWPCGHEMSDKDCQDVITYGTTFHLFWGGKGVHNTFLFIISFYLPLPSEVCRTNTIITLILEIRKLEYSISLTFPSSPHGRMRIRSQIFISQPNTLINQTPTAQERGRKK